MLITLLCIGKTKEAWLQQAINFYIQRLIPYTRIDMICVKTEEQLLKEVKKHSPIILLDETGKSFSSVQFSQYLIKTLEDGGARACFVIGHDTGLPETLKHSSHLKISLSQMTFTHQMVRCILLEQIYRAFEIHKGSNYHRI